MEPEDLGFTAFMALIVVVLVGVVIFGIRSENAFEDRCHKAGGHVVDQYKSDSLCFIDGKLAFSE